MNIPPVSVYCGRPNGLTVRQDGVRITFQYGVNHGVDRVAMGRWLNTHQNLTIVRNGTIRVVYPADIQGVACP